MFDRLCDQFILINLHNVHIHIIYFHFYKKFNYCISNIINNKFYFFNKIKKKT